MNGCQSCERTMKYKDGPKVYKSHMPFCFEFQVWRSELETKTRRPWKGIGLHRPWPPHSVGVRWSYVSWFRLRARGVELCFIVVWIPDCDRALLLLPSDTTGHWWRNIVFFFRSVFGEADDAAPYCSEPEAEHGSFPAPALKACRHMPLCNQHWPLMTTVFQRDSATFPEASWDLTGCSPVAGGGRWDERFHSRL